IQNLCHSTELCSFKLAFSTDLATINNLTDSNLIASVPNNIVRSWIGLELGDVSRWHWAWLNKKNSISLTGRWCFSICDAGWDTENNTVTGNLILICENMTWMEASSYCRENYMDLVFITEQSTQDLVAQMAQNSTSSHIWLGLRYTCTFGLWFWSGSSADCYQNWAPGQGPPERAYECGVTGAMLTTEGQQWVGLPERRQLNFICQDCAG
uniref:C-type lectin domain-containing protein n=1 Tax=Hippocampus comes TaxID=109280 RepID=A0A3Q2YXR0_HIPCM